MPRRPRTPMPVSQRAKQFAPFRAMTGLEEALAAMETTPVPRPVLSEDAAAELNSELNRLYSRLNRSGCKPDSAFSPPDCKPDSVPEIRLTWYHAGQIHTKTGRLSRIDCTCRYLYWDQTDPIPIEDLLSVSESGDQ